MSMTKNGLSDWQAECEEVDLLDTAIGDLLDRRAVELPSQEAIVYSCYPEFGDALNIRWTYQEYREQVNQVAKGLLALGLGKGDHIAVLAVNLPEWPLLLMAAAKTGLVLVTVNPVLREVIATGSAVSDEALAQRQTSVRPSDTDTLIYTSGTAGFPKGALLSHHGLVSNAVLTAERLAPGPRHL